MLKVLQMSNDFLDGSPWRLSKLLTKHSTIRSRCVIGEQAKYRNDSFTDLSLDVSPEKDIIDKITWADIIHVHGSYSKFSKYAELISKKKMVCQPYEHSEECLEENLAANAYAAAPDVFVPGGVIRYLLPHPIDISEELPIKKPEREKPFVLFVVSERPSTLLREFSKVERVQNMTLLPTKEDRCDIIYSYQKSADIVLDCRHANSYSTSFLNCSLGSSVLCCIKPQTRKNIEILSEVNTLPWTPVDRLNAASHFLNILSSKLWVSKGEFARSWMERYWSPSMVISHYEEMYADL